MGIGSRGSADAGAREREYAWEAAVHGVDIVAAWRQFLADTAVAVPNEDENWEAAEDEDEETLNRRAASQAAQDLQSADFAVRWDACRDLARLQRFAAPHMPALAELVKQETEYDVKRVAKKALRELEKADKAGWPVPPERPDRFEAVAGPEAVGDLEKAGIPVQRLRSLEVAKRLFVRLKRLKVLDLKALGQAYVKLGMPLEPGMSRQELVDRLAEAALWSELEMPELARECQERQVPEQVEAEDEARQRCELAARLLQDTCERAWEARGIPVRRLGSFQAAASVVERRGRLDQKSDEALERECTDRGFPMERGIARDELLRRLGLMTLWDALPLTELQAEVAALGRAAGTLPSRQSIMEQLLVAHCTGVFEAKGVPVLRLGSFRTAVRLSDMCTRLEALGPDELEVECSKLGLLVTPVQREEQLRHLCASAMWNVLSFSELSREWSGCAARLRDRGVASPGAPPGGSESEQRKRIMELLLLASSVEAWEAAGLPVQRCGSLQGAAKLMEGWSRLEGLDAAQLEEEAAALGVPLPGLEHPERLARAKTLATWKQLPLPELKKECPAFGVSLGPLIDDKEEVLKRLMKAAREQWVVPPQNRGMANHLKILGLPPTADSDDVKRAFRQLALKYHPDKNIGESQGDAAKAFREVREAYDILCRHMGLQSS